MITHGTPPVAHGGWAEFIKDFGIGLPRFGRVCVEMCVDSHEIENFYYNQWVIVMFGGRGVPHKSRINPYKWPVSRNVVEIYPALYPGPKFESQPVRKTHGHAACCKPST